MNYILEWENYALLTIPEYKIVEPWKVVEVFIQAEECLS